MLRFESRFERWRPAIKGGWRESGDPDEAGGVLYDLGSHLVDQALAAVRPGRAGSTPRSTVAARRPVDDDAFVALTHAAGVRSHLWMSAVDRPARAAHAGAGDRAGYTSTGWTCRRRRCARRAARRSRAGARSPPDRYGVLGVDGDLRPVPTEPGAYQSFYAQVAAALRDGGPLPVDPRTRSHGRADRVAHRSAAEGVVLPVPTA